MLPSMGRPSGVHVRLERPGGVTRPEQVRDRISRFGGDRGLEAAQVAIEQVDWVVVVRGEPGWVDGDFKTTAVPMGRENG